MLVSIIIPAYNAEETLARCVEACLKQTHPEIEVIVVDDGSTDRTAQIAESLPVRYVRQENRGPAAARNHGARIAAGEVLAFTDADCFPEPDWIEKLLTGFTEGVAGVGGTYGIANPEKALARMVHEEIVERHARFGDEVDFLGSFNVAYKKSAFDAVGGFDETFRIASAEDNDLAYRLQDNGGKLRFVREALVAHVHPAKFGPYLRTQFRHGFWRMKLYAKHPRRARGDKYASVGHLLAAPLALLTTLATLVVTFAWWVSKFVFVVSVAVALVLTFGYLLLYYPMQLRMERRTKDWRMIFFTDVVFVRDVARALGMIGGIWTFAIRRKAGTQ